MALLIRRSSVRARRGPPGVFAGTFALLRGLRSVSYPPELPRGACHVDVESGTLNPQVVVTNAAGLTIGLRTSDGLVNPSPRMRSQPQTLAVRNESAEPEAAAASHSRTASMSSVEPPRESPASPPPTRDSESTSLP